MLFPFFFNSHKHTRACTHKHAKVVFHVASNELYDILWYAFLAKLMHCSNNRLEWGGIRVTLGPTSADAES